MTGDALTRAVRDALRRRAGSVVLDDLAGCRLTGAALLAEIDACAERLRGLGTRRLALMADNGAAWVIHALAAPAADVSLLPLPPFFSGEQLRHVLEEARPDLLVCDGPERLASLGLPPGSDPAGPRHTLWRAMPTTDTAVAGDELISFTSGSTGRPKGTRLASQGLLAVVTSMIDATGARDDDRHLCSLPLAVLLEWTGGVCRALLSGGVALVPSLVRLGTGAGQGVDGSRLAQLLVDQQAASAVLVPETLGALVDAAGRGALHGHGLRFLGVGGAVTPAGLLRRADELGLPVFEGYGLTECCSVVCLNTPDARRLGTVGRPLPHARVHVAPDGELLVEGALLRGRLGGPDRPADAPWPTGDLGSVDDEGFVTLRGRKDNLLRTASGRNVSPEWIEALLLDLPSVRQAVVLGDGLPRPYAVVVAQDPFFPPGDDDLQAVNQGLPAYARLQALLVAPTPFTVADGCWTATGRPRRAQIAAAWPLSPTHDTLTEATP